MPSQDSLPPQVEDSTTTTDSGGIAEPPVTTEPPVQRGSVLFASGFEEGVAIGSLTVVGSTWRTPIGGRDCVGDWRTDLPGGLPAALFPLIDGGVENASDYVDARIEEVAGRDGLPTRALYIEVSAERPVADDEGRVRSQLPVFWDGDHGYVAYDLMLQPDLEEFMPRGSWRFVVEWREEVFGGNEYRMWLGIRRTTNGTLVWEAVGQLLGTDEFIDWRYNVDSVPVVAGEWLRLETSWESDEVDGRLWVALNGETIVDHEGRTRFQRPLASIHAIKAYTGADSLALGPVYQWVDNVVMADDIPENRDTLPEKCGR